MPTCVCGSEVQNRSWNKHKRECNRFADAFDTPKGAQVLMAEIDSNDDAFDMGCTPLGVTVFAKEAKDYLAREGATEMQELKVAALGERTVNSTVSATGGKKRDIKSTRDDNCESSSHDGNSGSDDEAPSAKRQRTEEQRNSSIRRKKAPKKKSETPNKQWHDPNSAEHKELLDRSVGDFLDNSSVVNNNSNLNASFFLDASSRRSGDQSVFLEAELPELLDITTLKAMEAKQRLGPGLTKVLATNPCFQTLDNPVAPMKEEEGSASLSEEEDKKTATAAAKAAKKKKTSKKKGPPPVASPPPHFLRRINSTQPAVAVVTEEEKDDNGILHSSDTTLFEEKDALSVSVTAILTDGGLSPFSIHALHHAEEILKLCLQFRLDHSTFHLAMSVLHRLYEQHHFPVCDGSKAVKLVLSSVVLIAAKMEEQEIKLVSHDLVKLNKCALSRVNATERLLTAVLGFRLNYVTPLAMMETTFLAHQFTKTEQQWSTFLSDLCYFYPQDTLFCHPSSLVAAVSVGLGRALNYLITSCPEFREENNNQVVGEELTVQATPKTAAAAVAAAVDEVSKNKKKPPASKKKKNSTSVAAAPCTPQRPTTASIISTLTNTGTDNGTTTTTSSFACWTPLLAELTGYSLQSLLPLVRTLVAVLLGLSTTGACSLWKRYSGAANGHLLAQLLDHIQFVEDEEDDEEDAQPRPIKGKKKNSVQQKVEEKKKVLLTPRVASIRVVELFTTTLAAQGDVAAPEVPILSQTLTPKVKAARVSQQYN